MNFDYEAVKKRTILRSVVGSTAYGLAVEGSDQDILGVCIEPLEEAIGLGSHFEQLESKTPDVKIYSLQKFLRLAMKGNPNILELFFIEPQYLDARGAQLLDLRPHIISRAAQGPYLGYLHSQLLRLIGEKGQKRCHRPENESKFGYDTKYAMHMLRLGFQGVELLTTGSLSFPIREPNRSYLRAVRAGEVSLEACVARAKALEEEIRLAVSSSPLPPEPNWSVVEEWMVRIYIRNWAADRQYKDLLEHIAMRVTPPELVVTAR